MKPYGFGLLVVLMLGCLLSAMECGVDYAARCGPGGHYPGGDCSVLNAMLRTLLALTGMAAMGMAFMVTRSVKRMNLPESLRARLSAWIWLMAIAFIFLCVGFYFHIEFILFCDRSDADGCKTLGMLKPLGTAGISIGAMAATWIARDIGQSKRP